MVLTTLTLNTTAFMPLESTSASHFHHTASTAQLVKNCVQLKALGGLADSEYMTDCLLVLSL